MLSRLFDRLPGRTRRILDACLDEVPVSVEDALHLSGVTGPELSALCLVADELRHRQVGDAVTYVVNRNINFTNVCVKTCRFCAFSRDLRSEQGYLLDTEEVVRRALQARDMGATEVCVQAGLIPEGRGRMYTELIRAIKAAAPELHVHAWSPEEVKYGAALRRMPIRDFLVELQAAGLDSLPGTSAEILDDRVRERIGPGRISTAQWIEVIRTAHELGLRTTATMMFGHVESAADRVRHLDLLRRMQSETGGFTEFVPLSFVHDEAPLFARDEAVGGGPTGVDVVRVYALARVMLGSSFRNIQASWVKEGLREAQRLLDSGVNDLGGTLINESISTSAGAQHGQLVRPRELRRIIRAAGRVPVERNTRYEALRRFEDPAEDPVEPLDEVEDPEEVFGTYVALTEDRRFHYTFTKPPV